MACEWGHREGSERGRSLIFDCVKKTKKSTGMQYFEYLVIEFRRPNGEMMFKEVMDDNSIKYIHEDGTSVSKIELEKWTKEIDDIRSLEPVEPDATQER